MSDKDRASLTPEALRALMIFFARDGGDSEEEYKKLRRRLITVLEVRCAEYRLRATPEDLADEAIYRVAGQLERGLEIKASDPFKYFYGVVRHVLQETARSERKLGGDIDDIADSGSPLPHMLPPPEKFSSRVRKLGLGDGDAALLRAGARRGLVAREPRGEVRVLGE